MATEDIPHPLQLGRTFNVDDLLFWTALGTALVSSVTAILMIIKTYRAASK